MVQLLLLLSHSCLQGFIDDPFFYFNQGLCHPLENYLSSSYQHMSCQHYCAPDFVNLSSMAARNLGSTIHWGFVEFFHVPCFTSQLHGFDTSSSFDDQCLLNFEIRCLEQASFFGLSFSFFCGPIGFQQSISALETPRDLLESQPFGLILYPCWAIWISYSFIPQFTHP